MVFFWWWFPVKSVKSRGGDGKIAILLLVPRCSLFLEKTKYHLFVFPWVCDVFFLLLYDGVFSIIIIIIVCLYWYSSSHSLTYLLTTIVSFLSVVVVVVVPITRCV